MYLVRLYLKLAWTFVLFSPPRLVRSLYLSLLIEHRLFSPGLLLVEALGPVSRYAVFLILQVLPPVLEKLNIKILN